MKLGSLKEGGRDGTLVVVSRDLSRAVRATGIAATLQRALEDWSNTAPRLNALAQSLESGDADGVFDVDPNALAAPLPRAYEFLDGSAYLPHVERVRRARGAEVPESFYTDPLMYQATSAGFHGPRDPVRVVSEEYGIDLEAEIVVVTDDVPMAVTPEQAAGHIQLVGLVNDVSLRNLIPAELGKGFGFLQSKPASALSPVFATPDELGEAWADGKLSGTLKVDLNGRPFGRAEAGEDMTFDFPALIAHAARTRRLAAGTIVGSGTVSNKLDGGHGKPVAAGGAGYSCLAELRIVGRSRLAYNLEHCATVTGVEEGAVTWEDADGTKRSIARRDVALRVGLEARLAGYPVVAISDGPHVGVQHRSGRRKQLRRFREEHVEQVEHVARAGMVGGNARNLMADGIAVPSHQPERGFHRQKRMPLFIDVDPVAVGGAERVVVDIALP